MKDARFIELLNLYLDHHLTPQESAELEAEVRRNPQRREVYTDYCRMQKACTLLFEAERTGAPRSAAMAARAGRMAPVRTTFFGPGLRLVAGCAAAACLVVVVVRFNGRSSTSPSSTSGSLAANAGAGAAARPNIEVVANEVALNAQSRPDSVMKASDFHSVFITNGSLRAKHVVEAEAVADQHSAGLDWLKGVALPNLRDPRVEDLTFEGVSLSKQTEPRSYGNRRAFQGEAEMSSFQFQR